MKRENYYQFHPIQNELICYHNTSHYCQKEPFMLYHRHNAYEIYLFIRGNTKLFIEQSCYQLKAGQLAVINPNELHRSACADDQPYERYGINIKPLLLEHLSSRQTNLAACFNHPVGHNNLIQLTEAQITEFIARYNAIQEASASRDYGSDLLLQAELTKFLLFINRLYQQSDFQAVNLIPELVKDTMGYIQQHLREPLSLEQLAEHFYLNGSYISRQFKLCTGLTIREYILDQRVCLAKSLLLEGKNVSEACSLSGFSDYSNFIRSFTKLVGISPGKYRRQMAESRI